MKVNPKVKATKSGYICYFEVTKEKAIEITSKEEHSFSFEIEDNRNKSYAQIKLFWALLNEFCEFLFPDLKMGKKELDNIKLSLYHDYQSEKGIKISLSKSNVTNARLFIDWVIINFAENYNFISKSLELQNNFNDSYVYSTIIAKKCSICGNTATVLDFSGKYMALCEKHCALTKKELSDNFHLEPIKIKKELIELFKEKNV